MNAAAWGVCKKPDVMLPLVADRPARKQRLFALACCARIDHLITDPRSRAALEFATRHVETPVNRQLGRVKVEKAARAAHDEFYAEIGKFTDERGSACLVRSCAALAAVQTVTKDPAYGADYASSFACLAVAWGEAVAAKMSPRTDTVSERMKAPEFAAQADLLRDIFGNPFRPVALDPAWLTADVLALAEGIYADRAFDRMPILADALQDAGCENEQVLAHCRDAAQVHVRGCWVVDLLLGKE